MFNKEMTFNFYSVKPTVRYQATDGGALVFFDPAGHEFIVQASRLNSGTWQLLVTERSPGKRIAIWAADAPNPQKAAEVLNDLLKERGLVNNGSGRRKPPPRD